MPKPVTQHPKGHYRFLRGAAAFSSGVAANPGYEIIHAVLVEPRPWKDGLQAAKTHLQSAGLDANDLCAVELRCGTPHSLDSFSTFNNEYAALIESWDLMVEGQNPIARTNVSPVINPPRETMLHGFSFVQAARTAPPTFVLSGGAELPHRELDPKHVVRLGETSDEAIAEKAACATGIMQIRLSRLQLQQHEITHVNIYTQHAVGQLFDTVFAKELPCVSRTGIHWLYSRPPIVELDFEMSLRGTQQEIVVNL